MEVQFINFNKWFGEEKRRQKGSESMKLSLRQKFVLLVKGSVFLRWKKREGWSKARKIYACKCSKHGLYSGARHGISDSPPQCLVFNIIEKGILF